MINIVIVIKKFKKLLYFPTAYYFRFWAQIQLNFWKPTVVAVTGSSGKTTLLHLIESQLGNKAKYSHLANSSYGIPFNILGLKRKNLTPDEWLYLFILAPFKAFKKPPSEKIYVVEADCDRPNEGKFLASLLKPSISLWTNSSRTHTKNFDCLVSQKKFPSVEEAIAYEFGYFLQYSSDLIIVNGDNELIAKERSRSKAHLKSVTKKELDEYKILKGHTEFKINGTNYKFKVLLPKETFYSIQMTLALLEYLKIDPDRTFSKFILAPSRYSLFKGIRDTTIIDSTYNATPDGVRTILEMFGEYPAQNKWLVLGDMIELGNEEKEEHEKLADIINSMRLDKIILVGPRLAKYTCPKLKKAKTFLMPKDALDYLMQNIKGEETILFKGARFLEGIIEQLLANKNDIKKLCRQEKAWKKRRKQWRL